MLDGGLESARATKTAVDQLLKHNFMFATSLICDER
jgi:hypothetical protein